MRLARARGTKRVPDYTHRRDHAAACSTKPSQTCREMRVAAVDFSGDRRLDDRFHEKLSVVIGAIILGFRIPTYVGRAHKRTG